MLNREQIKTATVLMDKVQALRDARFRLQKADIVSINAFEWDVRTSVPEDKIESIKAIALAFIESDISEIEQKLTELGISAE